MSKATCFFVPFISFVAWAAPDARLDAFLDQPATHALVAPAELSPLGRSLWRDGRVTSVEPRWGVPTFFWAGRPEQTADLRAMGLSPEQAARRVLMTHAELWRQVPAVLAESPVKHVHDVGDGPVIVTFAQTVQGLPVFRSELKVLLDRRLNLVAISGAHAPQSKVKGEFRLAETSAIANAWLDLTGRGLESDRLSRPSRDAHGDQWFQVVGEASTARTRQVLFPIAAGLEPAFYVELDAELAGTTDSDMFSYVVSAVDGRLLYRKNLTVSDGFTYRVWADSTNTLHEPFDGPQGNGPTPHPTGTPNSFAPPYVPTELVSLVAGPISTNDPWLAATATETQGNNANVYADLNSPNGFGAGDLRASVTAPGVFDRTYDPAVSPNASETQRQAAITQLFYDVNFFHDWYYDVGFDEKSGNAQNDNFGRGGRQNDGLVAEAQDFSGRNNANMSTPSDGARPRMQMYVFDGGRGRTIELQTPMAAAVAAGGATFGPQVFNLSGQLVLVDDGDTSNMGTKSDGCSVNFVTPVAGKIAFIDRGTCTFADKAQNAQANGAIGVIIANNQGGGAFDLNGTSSTVTIPVMSVGRTDGTSLKSLMAGTTAVTLTMKRVAVIDRDGTIDNAIVAHEWGHYISNRLIGDGNGLSTLQGVGMGEGWGDFHAMLLVVKGSDRQAPNNANYGGVYGLAAYTSAGLDPNGYYWGIRRVPYSTNFQRNGLTFKHTQENVPLPTGVPTKYGTSGRGNSEVHATGEVWATMLWECYAALLNDSRYTFEQARERMRRYLVGGYKATALMPTFIDARDAILATAAATDAQDFATLSAAFARRGLGMRAVAAPRDSSTNGPLTESFLTGNDFQVTEVTLDDSVAPCDKDGVLDNAEKGLLTLKLKNIGTGTLAQTTAKVSTSSAGVSIAGGPSKTFAAIPPFGSGTVSFEVTLDGGNGMKAIEFDISVDDPTLATPGPVKVPGKFRVNTDVKAKGSATDDVESPMPLWTVHNDPRGNTGSDWRRLAQSATEHLWFGPNPASPADTWLLSPALLVSNAAPFVLTMKHRYDFEGDAQEYYDGGVIELSVDNGQSWVDVGTALYPATLSGQGNNPLRGRKAFSGKSPNNPAFETLKLDLGMAYAGKSVRLRFRIGSDDAAAVRGWEIDDIGFEGLSEQPFPLVVGDPNLCTNRAPTATATADQTVTSGTLVNLGGMASDPDGDMLTLTWTQTSGTAVTVSKEGTFTAPAVEAPTPLNFELVAFDGRASSAPAPARVVVTPGAGNQAPVVSVPARLEIEEGTPLSIPATGVDPEGQPLTWVWTQVSGPEVTLGDATTATVVFVAPQVDAETTLTLQVVANDGSLSSAPAVVEVVVKDAGTPAATPKPCGCSTGAEGLVPLLGLASLRRRRRAQR